MAKKKKKPQRKQGHPAKVNANVMSLAHAKVKRGLDALTPDYVRWYEQTYQGTGAVEMDLMAVRDSLSFYADLVGLDSVTDFDPQAIVAIVHGLVEREEHREDQKHLGMILSEAWISYSLFLEESGLWKHHARELEMLRDGLHSTQFSFNGGPGIGGIFEEEAELSTEEREAAAKAQFDAMPVVALGHAMAAWVAQSPERRWDSNDPQPFIQSAMQELEASIPSGITGERREIIMGYVFMSLVMAGVLSLDFGQPQLMENAEGFATAEGDVGLGATYLLVRSMVQLLIATPEEGNEEADEVWDLTLGWLTAAQDGEPHLVAEDRYPDRSEEVWAKAHARMREMIDLGIVESGDYYTVPPMVQTILADLEDEDLGPEDDEESLYGDAADWEEEELFRPARTEPYTGKVLQLKLGLRDTKPPIWRRVLVPMDLHLGDLHDIIQAAFDWDNTHLHIFRTGLYDGTSYGADIPELEVDVDETAALVSEVLKAEKDRLEYSYDFGDDWRVRIDVEKVLDGDGEFLPRCTGGRRFSPLENSGGTEGWDAKMDIIRDAGHPEHEEVQEWLADTYFEIPDPAEFTIESVNERLMAEF
ncbi:plasmid pRiA4b ORF-3 family protein [Glutamicibacter soli]|uniref:plasmid pRiA4b ORF-3 family protein n=1 Tax=Glutamicibacter soli TaxID=453836 RepID=UPI003FD0997B